MGRRHGRNAPPPQYNKYIVSFSTKAKFVVAVTVHLADSE